MSQTRFQILVLRFIALIIRAKWIGGWGKPEMEELLEEVENEIRFIPEDRT